MSGIFLQSTDGGEVIEVPLGKTVIGRGPFLQITDKRVSRSHAELEVENDVLYITPTHTNPCFLRRGGEESQMALPKDKRRILETGDVFGLLPEQLFFTVCGKQGAVNGTSVKVKEEPKSQTSTLTSTQKKKEKAVKDEDPDAFLDDMEEEEEDVKPKKTKTKNNKPGAVVDVPGKHKMAMPLDKKRVLPDWMIRMAAVGPIPDKKKAKPTAKIPAVAKRGAEAPTPRKRGPAKRKYDDDDEEEFDEDERRLQRRRNRPSRRAAAYNDDDDDDDDLTPRKRPSRAARESRGSYVEEFVMDDDDSDESLPEHLKRVKDDDSDFEIDEGGDSGSDWETRGKGKQKGRGRGRPSATPRRTGRRGRPRKVRDDEDEEEEEDDDPEAYVPRPSKRRGGASKRKKDESEEEESEEDKPRKKTGKRKKHKDSEEESEEETKVIKKTDKRKKKEESEEEDDEVEKPAKKKAAGKKKRKRCEFGKKCYRKNPVHFEEYCHPGDDTYDENSDDEDDDGKQECEFGSKCYRTNAQHRKDYSHKKLPTRPQRKTARNDKKSAVAGDDDDDGLPNTYDYNDSFIDDVDLDGSESSEFDEPEEDSDYDPGEEDVKSLMKEAKGFVKKKKMRQPVGKKIEIKMD